MAHIFSIAQIGNHLEKTLSNIIKRNVSEFCHSLLLNMEFFYLCLVSGMFYDNFRFSF